MKRTIVLVGILISVSACSMLSTVSLTEIPKDRSHAVSAEVSKWVVLSFNFNNDFLNPIRDQLKNQCPNGQVKGILTKDEIVNMYLIVYQRKVSATGYCVS